MFTEIGDASLSSRDQLAPRLSARRTLTNTVNQLETLSICMTYAPFSYSSRYPSASGDENPIALARKVFLIAEICVARGNLLRSFELCKSKIASWLFIIALHGALSAHVHAPGRPIIPRFYTKCGIGTLKVASLCSKC